MPPFDSLRHYTWDEAREVYGDRFVDLAQRAGIWLLKRGLVAKGEWR